MPRGFDPLRDILTLQERMNRLFEESLARGRQAPPSAGSGTWLPLADVYQTADAFVVQVELAGLGDDDVEVTVDGDELRLRGERRLPGPARPERFYRMERSYGAFSRSFRLGEQLDPDKVTAEFRDGLLRLELSKLR